MESSTIITVVTALAALIGAASPIIVSLIQSNKDKPEKPNGIYVPPSYVLHRPKTQIRWFVVLSFAFLGGVLGYSGARLASHNQPTEMPTIIPTIQNASETPEPFFTNPVPSETVTETPIPIPTATNQPATTFVVPVPTIIFNTPVKALQGDFVLTDVLVSPTENGTWLTLNGGSYGWGNVVVFEDDTTWVKPASIGASPALYTGGYEVAKLASSSMFQIGCGLPDGCLHIYLRRVAQGKVISEEIIERPSLTNIIISSTSPSNVNKSESFRDPTFRHVSLSSGELLVGTAVRFAIRAYGCNTMDIKENIPYTIFLLRGPLEVDVEIYNGGWDYWADIYDENFVKSLLEPKRDEVKQHPNYPTVGHVECIIPPFK